MKPKMKPGGRYIPPKNPEIDHDTFEQCCKIQCTPKEICSVLQTSKSVLDRWVHQTYNTSLEKAIEYFAQEGKASLRRLQFRHAQESVPMSIHLGKVYLDQTDKKDVKMTGDIPVNVINYGDQ